MFWLAVRTWSAGGGPEGLPLAPGLTLLPGLATELAAAVAFGLDAALAAGLTVGPEVAAALVARPALGAEAPLALALEPAPVPIAVGLAPAGWLYSDGLAGMSSRNVLKIALSSGWVHSTLAPSPRG